MRLLLAAAVCLISLSVTAKTYHADEVEFKDKLFYDKEGNKLTGEVIKNYPNGKKFAHFKIVNGQSQESELFYPNGKLKNKETAAARTEYWPNGQKRRESNGNRTDGNDVRKFYTGAGKLLIEAPFKNNQIDGTVKIYHSDGFLQEERPYARVLRRTIKTDKGEQPVQLSALHGVGKLYDVDKRLMATTDYDAGVVKKITHFNAAGTPLPTVVNNEIKALGDKTCKESDGKPFSGALVVNTVTPQVQFYEIPCRDGVIDGLVRVYLGAYGTYGRIYDTIPFKNGKRNGIARVYAYSDLLLSGEVPYHNNQVDGIVREYYETGELRFETPYKNNQIDGVRKIYGSALANPVGDVLRGEFFYTDGQLNGIATLYDTLGAVQQKVTYLFGKEVFTKEYDNVNKAAEGEKTAQALKAQPDKVTAHPSKTSKDGVKALPTTTPDTTPINSVGEKAPETTAAAPTNDTNHMAPKATTHPATANSAGEKASKTTTAAPVNSTGKKASKTNLN